MLREIPQHLSEFIRLDFKRAALLFIVNVAIQTFYAIAVCPYVENLTIEEIILANLGITLFVLGLRQFIFSQMLIKSCSDFSSRRLILVDTGLVLTGGIIWGIFNSIVHEFPPESGLKVLTGFLSAGLLSGILLYLTRIITLFKITPNFEDENVSPKSYISLSKDLLVVALMIIGLVLLNGIFVVFKDITWIITLEEGQFMWAVQSILLEVIFIAVVYALYIFSISSLYSTYLRLQLNNQTRVLNAVSKGNFDDYARSVGRDEFSIVAQYTNRMIGQLREHAEIAKSISYTKNIQDALLPAKGILDRYFRNSFVFFQPRDTISGDFYWVEQRGDHLLFAVADSTGHGVPGAMVSIVCINALNKAVKEENLLDPAQILATSRDFITHSFQASEKGIKDGMDISFCTLNLKTLELKWAGAYNPLWIISTQPQKNASKSTLKANLFLHEWSGDRQPVGLSAVTAPFTTHTIQLHEGDRLYLFSDGYADQFGGPNGKKLKKRAFKHLLVSTHGQGMQEQCTTLQTEFERWQGELDQVDDVCVIGVEL